MRGRVPVTLMFHKCDHYSATATIVNGGQVPAYALVNSDIPCNVQEMLSSVSEQYKQRDDNANSSVYMIHGPAYLAITIKDRIVFNGTNFRVLGKQDMINLKRVCRVDITTED